MILADGVGGLLLFGLWLFCLIDAITTPEAAIRNLPKVVWVLIVLLLFDLGALAWLIAGRPWNGDGRARVDTAGRAGYPEYDRPGRHVPANPDDDEAFLRQVRRRADDQRRQYEARRRADLDAEQSRLLRRPEDDDPRD